MLESRMNRYNQVTIIGVGLIGGSIGRELVQRRLARKVIGFDRSQKNIANALKSKLITDKGNNLIQSICHSDLIVMALPVKEIIKTIKRIFPHVPKRCLVIDVGSTKQNIVKQADKYFIRGNFVGCHPMAGSEKSGPQPSLLHLFDKAPCLIVRGTQTKKVFFQQAKRLWCKFGSLVYEIDVKTHDKYLADCSHLPHLISFSLMNAVAKRMGSNHIRKISGKSFKTFTRVAGSDSRMWADIFLDNDRYLLQSLSAFKKELDRFEKWIAKKEASQLRLHIKRASEKWKNI